MHLNNRQIKITKTQLVLTLKLQDNSNHKNQITCSNLRPALAMYTVEVAENLGISSLIRGDASFKMAIFKK